MRTPKEIVDGCFGDRVAISRESFEEWVSKIQQDAFESGRISGVHQACASVHAISRGTHSEERSVILDNCESVILDELNHHDFHRDSDKPKWP